jgi:aldehyde dehydrogenase (NAD+)
MDVATRSNTASLRALFDRQKRHYAAHPIPDAPTRIDRLRRLQHTLIAHRSDIREAVFADFRKPAEEADVTELSVMLAELHHAIRSVRHWMKPRRLKTPLPYLGTSARLYTEPKGVVLVLGPWNYPIMLSLGPVISALAAGNRVVLKPSEVAPASSALLARLVREAFDDDEVAVVEGDREVAESLLELPFDHVFFTGSPAVGRVVMESAAKQLSSVTLELGGQSPAVVHPSADLALSARRIAFGKFSNAGQTCVAPDYLLAHRSIYPAIIDALRDAIAAMYGDGRPPAALAGIVSDRHFARLTALLEDAVARGARVAAGGVAFPEIRTLLPTLLIDVPPDARILHEEIFGPILPLLPYDDLEEAIRYVNDRPPALTMSLFGSEEAFLRTMRERTATGSILENDTLIHFGHTEMPFGGHRDSGVGRSHGRAGFMAFSNERPVLRQRAGKTALFGFLYPPYNRASRSLIEILLRWYGR